ncbi:MAG: response regulator, partial [Chloroflexi bacterium]|nr:response regulator [Chloroflexota bacterium]
YSPELIFLDIEMPDGDGFSLINKLKANNVFCDIIFVTAYNQYAIKAFKYAAFDYLLKPIDRQELLESIQRYRHKTNTSMSEKIDKLQINYIG